MKQFFALDPSSLQHFAMNKAHTPDPSLPKAAFVSTEGPVISTMSRDAAIISGDNQKRIVPETKRKAK